MSSSEQTMDEEVSSEEEKDNDMKYDKEEHEAMSSSEQTMDEEVPNEEEKNNDMKYNKEEHEDTKEKLEEAFQDKQREKVEEKDTKGNKVFHSLLKLLNEVEIAAEKLSSLRDVCNTINKDHLDKLQKFLDSRFEDPWMGLQYLATEALIEDAWSCKTKERGASSASSNTFASRNDICTKAKKASARHKARSDKRNRKDAETVTCTIKKCREPHQFTSRSWYSGPSCWACWQKTTKEEKDALREIARRFKTEKDALREDARRCKTVGFISTNTMAANSREASARLPSHGDAKYDEASRANRNPRKKASTSNLARSDNQTTNHIETVTCAIKKCRAPHQFTSKGWYSGPSCWACWQKTSKEEKERLKSGRRPLEDTSGEDID